MKILKILAVVMLLILPLLVAAAPWHLPASSIYLIMRWQAGSVEYPQLTIDMVAGAAGLLLTFVFAYFPKLNTWYASKDKAYKQLYMAGLVTLCTAIAFALGCYSYLETLFHVTIACTQESAIGLLRAIVIGLVVNQGVFSVLPEAKTVTAAKAARVYALPKDNFPHAEG